jgi:hypothetical protein
LETSALQTTNAKRREDVKRGTVERRARKREQVLMEAQDRLSLQLRIQWVHEQQLLKMKADFGERRRGALPSSLNVRQAMV